MNKLFVRFKLPVFISLVLIVALAITTFVFADTTISDGDGVSSNPKDQPADTNLAAGTVCLNATFEVPVYIKRSGNYDNKNAFNAGETATVSAQLIQGTKLEVTFPPNGGNQIKVPADWGTVPNGTFSPAAFSTIKLSSLGAVNEQVSYSVTGTITRTDTMTVTANVIDCTPVDNIPPTITWHNEITNDSSFEYGSVPPAPTCTAVDTGSGPKSCEVSGYGTNVGSYTLTASALDNAGNEKTETRSYSVTPRPITVTADFQTKVYGEDDPELTYQVTDGSLVGSDSFSGALARDVGENVGPYAITQGDLALSTNYALTFVPGTLTITARPITVTANAQTKVYGEADPELTYKVSGALVGTDAFSGALVRAAGENVGPYAIAQGDLALSTNYNLTFIGEYLTITPRPITVTADPQTKVYGEVDPALTYHVSESLVGSDTFSGALVRAAGENVGPYAITQNTLALSDNYTITFVPGTLTITARPITVTADSKSKYFGQPDPALTYQITAGSLVGNDAFTGALTRAPGEAVGPYAINQGSLALSNNYAITFVSGTLTINAWTLTGFYQPVDMNSILNTVKGGSTVPLKFEVFAGSTELTDLNTVKATFVKEVTCKATVEDTIEVLATGGTSLRYDTTAGQFIYNWQTPKLAGHCYTVTMTTLDGSSISAYFKLK